MCCADLNPLETSLSVPVPLETSGSALSGPQQSPCTAAVTSAAATLFSQLSAPVADVAPALPVTVQSQVLEAVTVACTSPEAPALPEAAPEHLDTAMKEAASVLFGNLSFLRPTVNTAESDLKEDIALRRQSGLPLEEDMVISATSQSGETKSVAAFDGAEGEAANQALTDAIARNEKSHKRAKASGWGDAPASQKSTHITKLDPVQNRLRCIQRFPEV